MSNYEKIRLEVQDGVARITFNQPQYCNALDHQSLRETYDALQRVDRQEDVGAVVLTGEGKSFCAGFNLKEIPLANEGTEEIEEHFRVLS